jgi:hypothetical protein
MQAAAATALDGVKRESITMLSLEKESGAEPARPRRELELIPANLLS